MKKQTAVEWLLAQVAYKNNSGCWMADIGYTNIDDIAQQALQMEREQIMSAHIFAQLENGNGMIISSEEEQDESARNYYEQAYGK